MIDFYCLVVEAGIYSDILEYWPVDPATWFRLPTAIGWIIFYFMTMVPTYPYYTNNYNRQHEDN